MILRIITIIIVISMSNNLIVKSKYIANTAMSKRSEQESDKGGFGNLSNDFNDGNNLKVSN